MFENPYHIQQLTRMGLNAYNAFGCLLNYLIEPKPEVFLPVKDLQKVMTDPDPLILKIAIQLRVG